MSKKYSGKLKPKKFKKAKKSVLEDPKYTEMMSAKGIVEETKKRYLFSLTTYCYFCDQTLTEIYEEADQEEEDGIRLNKRKIRRKLINFRSFLNDHFANSTVKQRFQDIKQFYKFWGIERPDLPAQTLKREERMEFGDLPDKNMIKIAIEGTSNLNHIALVLFNFSSGSARTEIANTTLGEFIEGTKDYHNNNGNIEDIINQLSKRDDIIPIIKMHRQKTNRDYYTCCTPEASSAIIRALKVRDNLTLDSRLIDMSPQAINKAFTFINDKHEFGKVKTYRRFTSHKLRKLNATLIEDVAFANTIQGRQSDTITETYFFKNPERIREKYVEYLDILTINETIHIDYGKDKVEKLNKELEDRERQIEKLEESITSLRMSKTQAKTLYSKSFDLTRSKKEE